MVWGTRKRGRSGVVVPVLGVPTGSSGRRSALLHLGWPGLRFAATVHRSYMAPYHLSGIVWFLVFLVMNITASRKTAEMGGYFKTNFNTDLPIFANLRNNLILKIYQCSSVKRWRFFSRNGFIHWSISVVFRKALVSLYPTLCCFPRSGYIFVIFSAVFSFSQFYLQLTIS